MSLANRWNFFYIYIYSFNICFKLRKTFFQFNKSTNNFLKRYALASSNDVRSASPHFLLNNWFILPPITVHFAFYVHLTWFFFAIPPAPDHVQNIQCTFRISRLMKSRMRSISLAGFCLASHPNEWQWSA